MTKFEALTEEILDFFWRSSPTEATLTGIHDHDHELDRVDRDYLEEKNRKTRAYLDRLEQFKRKELTADEDIDWQLLKNHLASRIMAFEEIRYWETYPSGYLEICLYGLFVMVLREFAPAAERAAAFLSRLQKVPRLLADAKRNLKDPPAVFTRLAIEVAGTGPLFFQGAVPEMTRALPQRAQDLEKASREAQAAFLDYQRFLETNWLGKAGTDFAIGRDRFDFKLRSDHMLPYTADEVLEIGRKAKQITEVEIERTARTIDSKKTWWDLIEELKENHPASDRLAETYKETMMAARDFVRKKGLVTIPDGEELEVIPTPPFDRPTIPYAAYMSPAPFEREQKGFFYVTPIDESVSKDDQRAQLKGHPSYNIPVIALHEAYPGHHLQLVLANRSKSKVRRILATTVFIEGWALYCEEMMREAGFYSDPRTVLFKLKNELWRACRVIIDVGLHTGQMDYDQAVNLLVDAAKLQKVHAEKEVTRYTYTPTQPLSYLIGKNQILELRRDYQKKLGADFKLREFHDRLLSFGSIPVVLIRKALGI
jgi:uncharacterized protein (DUF885 family)